MDKRVGFLGAHAGAAVTSTFLFAEPLVTALLAVTLVEEEMSLSLLFGGLLIFYWRIPSHKNIDDGRFSKG